MIKHFDYKCDECDRYWDEWIDQLDVTVHCPNCGEEATQIPSAPNINFNKGPYDEYL